MRPLTHRVLALALLLAPAAAFAQSIFWLDDDFDPVPKAQAIYKATVADKRDGPGWLTEVRTLDGDQLRYRSYLSDPDMNADDSYWIGYYESHDPETGTLQQVGTHDSDGRFNGLIVGFTDDGKLGFEKPVKHGVVDGEVRCYNRATGLLRCRTPYVDGKIEGIKQTYSAGSLYLLEQYKDDERNGWAERYSIDGAHLTRRSHYRDDKLDGEQRHWNDEGRLVRLWRYADGQRDGEQRSWFNNGQLKSVEHYRDGQYVGENRWYDQKGRPARSRTYADDGSGELIASRSYNGGMPSVVMHHVERDGETLKITRWHDKNGYVISKRIENPDTGYRENISFFTNGRVRRHKVERNGQPVGKQYKANGSKAGRYTIERYDDNGKRHGKQQSYRDFELYAYSSFRHGTQVGDAVEYGYSGQRTESHYDDQGERHGTVTKTDADGELLSRAHYRHGVQVGDYVEYRGYDRRLIARGQYENGKRNGPWLMHENSQVWKGRYRNGVRVGRWVAITEQGYAVSAGYFDDQGRRDGTWYGFADNGRMTGLETYSHGTRDGRSASYGDDGSLIYEQYYRDGKYVDAPDAQS
ncbi:hypothetical protein C84B14_06216 [Salinisphaera sp. C84B14]|uniref:toxin-antitoxin system YwqK family antitoxin n=1 Tax=Salinisphaera sp. C84B14 TaxID=1304155 RepID=UPI00333FF2A8